MDSSLFQFRDTPVADALPARSSLHATTTAEATGRKLGSPVKSTANSANLDLLRSFAVLLVVGFHLAKFFNWRLAQLRVTDFGLLGVMLFFVHTTLVLMFSLERQSARQGVGQRAGQGGSLFFPFMIRRCFRIYPLAMLVVGFVYVFHIPSDLQFGKFSLLHQSAANLTANLFLIQNVTLQKANPGVLWSLPLELQMYLALPALFHFASRAKLAWAMVAFWWLVVGLWFAVGYSSGLLPLLDGGVRSPIEALLKYTRFAPCFLPGIIAYKLWSQPRIFPAWSWPAFLAISSAAFALWSGTQPIETGWFICFAIGLGICGFREMPENRLTWLTGRIARYSYGMYLLHYFAIWIGFVVCRGLNIGLQIAAFVSVLLALSVLLFHTVEAPLIRLGIKLSEKFELHLRSFGVKGRAPEPAT